MEMVDDMQATEQSSLHLCMHSSFMLSRAQTHFIITVWWTKLNFLG